MDKPVVLAWAERVLAPHKTGAFAIKMLQHSANGECGRTRRDDGRSDGIDTWGGVSPCQDENIFVGFRMEIGDISFGYIVF